MHIKQVTINGFRTYKNQVEVAPFSEHHNCVVGRNGSGKSNFFDAIRFALMNGRFTSLMQAERQQLLHEGAGANVMNAYVEIVFDNTSGRVAIDADEVMLRRSIGLKKDEFFLNKKSVQKTQVANMLESAGFSRANPYYIVQQGKVNTLCLMTDTQRLGLLKEVAGTRVYEERRQESLKIMAETNGKKEKIGEVVQFIDGRLSELEKDKTELAEYHTLDKTKRALEYTFYDKQLRKAQEQVEACDIRRQEEAEKHRTLNDAALNMHDDIKSVEKQIKEQQTRSVQNDKDGFDSEHSLLIRKRAQVELEVQTLEEKVESDTTTKRKLEKDLKTVEKDISLKQKELDSTAMPTYEEKKRAMEDATKQLADRQRRLEALHSKQGRSAQFRSEKERDAFLQKEIAQYDESAQAKQKRLDEENSDIGKLVKGIKAAEKKSSELSADMDKHKRAIENADEQLKTFKSEKDRLQEERKAGWKAQNTKTDERKAYLDSLSTGEHQVSSSMPRAIATGLKNIKMLEEKENISGVFGPVIELFTADNVKFNTALEVSAGNSLFHVVVDTDKTAALLMKKMEQHNLGRVTFLPLNRLKVHKQNYPETADILPLVQRLKYEPAVEKAMQQVFGSKVLCRNIETGSQYARSHNLDAYTLEGDEVNRSGGMSGGYYDPKRSRLQAMGQVNEARVKLLAVDEEIRAINSAAAASDKGVTVALSEIQKMESTRARARDAQARIAGELRVLQKTDKETGVKLTKKYELVELATKDLAELRLKSETSRAELGSELLGSLSAAEQSELRKLETEIATLTKENAPLSKALSKAEQRKNVLESLLSENLLLRQEEMQEQLTAAGTADDDDRAQVLEAKQRELEKIGEGIAETAAASKALEQQITEQNANMRNHNAELDALKAKESNNADESEITLAQMEKLLVKRSVAKEKQEENRHKLRELGTMPQMLDDYENVRYRCPCSFVVRTHVSTWSVFRERADGEAARVQRQTQEICAR
jgi:structural maintenance of chromosome 3 (chondroitin sulfate proteoglycan 6)